MKNEATTMRHLRRKPFLETNLLVLDAVEALTGLYEDHFTYLYETDKVEQRIIRQCGWTAREYAKAFDEYFPDDEDE